MVRAPRARISVSAYLTTLLSSRFTLSCVGVAYGLLSLTRASCFAGSDGRLPLLLTAAAAIRIVGHLV